MLSIDETNNYVDLYRSNQGKDILSLSFITLRDKRIEDKNLLKEEESNQKEEILKDQLYIFERQVKKEESDKL